MNVSPYCEQATGGSHELWLSVVNRILGDSPRNFMLDVCCGACAVTSKLDFYEVVASDILPRNDEVPRSWLFCQGNAVEILGTYRGQVADLVVCSDGLEHMTKEVGHNLLREMARVGHIAIVFTPTGDSMFDAAATDPHLHKSSWTAEDFHEIGWETEHFPNWHPTLGWGAIFAWKQSL